MVHRVRFDPDAEADLVRLHDDILDRSGSPAIAEAYLRRIVTHCLRLADAPMRGTMRDDVRPGLRTMGFERRATIAFIVGDQTVDVLRVLYGGRDIEALADD